MKKFIGQQVISNKFGNGVVLDVVESGDNHNLKIQFEDSIKEMNFIIAFGKGIINFADENINTYCKELLSIYNNSQKEQEQRKQEQILERKELEQKLSKNEPLINYRTINLNYIDELKTGDYCGTKAKDIYLSCCDNFGWNRTLSGFFGFQQPLYAKNAIENYSVWFLSNSNLNGFSNGNIKNYVFGDQIEEEYNKGAIYLYQNDLHNLKDIRITFIKVDKSHYVFGGVYLQTELYKNSKEHDILLYKRISEKYPF